jgi:hypothetical protein
MIVYVGTAAGDNGAGDIPFLEFSVRVFLGRELTGFQGSCGLRYTTGTV